eukprot:scpid43929/ scgid26287/ Beclin-1; Coiled-coil myosin-like BCL2-interacting protein
MASSKPENKQTEVYIVCQRCCQPLVLHPSFHTVESEELQRLAAPLVPEEEAASFTGESSARQPQAGAAAATSSDGVIRRNVSRMKGASGGVQDFALLTSPANLVMGNLSYRLKVSSQLFDIMSGSGEVDHPLCQECTSSLMTSIVKQLGTSETELKTYQEYLERLEKAPLPDETHLKKKLTMLEEEERQLTEQLKQVEQQRAQVDAEMKDQEKEEEQLDQEEERYYRDLGEHKYQERALLDEQQSVDNQLQHSQALLNNLEKTNVYNCTFHIWSQGHFGTINGFRLGRLPTVRVEWSEVNIAWGQAALLLHSMAMRLKIRFDGYRLVPYGNVSYIEVLKEKRTQLPLYSSNSFRIFSDSKFDNAMIAYLDMLSQFKNQVTAMAKQDGDGGGKSFLFPHVIQDGKIGDAGAMYSVRFQFNTEEHWTKAMRLVLVTLKWGLAFLTSRLNPLHKSS